MNFEYRKPFTIANKGTIYICDTSVITCFDTTLGIVKWVYEDPNLNENCVPCLIENNMLLCGTRSVIRCLNNAGNVIWTEVLQRSPAELPSLRITGNPQFDSNYYNTVIFSDNRRTMVRYYYVDTETDKTGICFAQLSDLGQTMLTLEIGASRVEGNAGIYRDLYKWSTYYICLTEGFVYTNTGLIALAAKTTTQSFYDPSTIFKAGILYIDENFVPVDFIEIDNCTYNTSLSPYLIGDKVAIGFNNKLHIIEDDGTVKSVSTESSVTGPGVSVPTNTNGTNIAVLSEGFTAESGLIIVKDTSPFNISKIPYRTQYMNNKSPYNLYNDTPDLLCWPVIKYRTHKNEVMDYIKIRINRIGNYIVNVSKNYGAYINVDTIYNTDYFEIDTLDLCTVYSVQFENLNNQEEKASTDFSTLCGPLTTISIDNSSNAAITGISVELEFIGNDFDLYKMFAINDPSRIVFLTEDNIPLLSDSVAFSKKQKYASFVVDLSTKWQEELTIQPHSSLPLNLMYRI